MDKNNSNSKEALQEAQKLAVEETLAELDGHLFGGLNKLEQVAAGRIRHAARRLLECAQQLDVSPLLVPGSTGQQRPHPLLKLEAELRREVVDGLEKLTFRANNRSFVDKQKARHRLLRQLHNEARTQPEEPAS